LAFKTPILFLIFNRPETTAQVFAKIALQKPEKLYVAADGPRPYKIEEKSLCEQARAITEQINWNCEVKRLYRNENLGCKMAVSSAISWFFEHEEEGIILEDDCLPSDSFFDYCQIALAKYRNNYLVMHINGYCPLQQSSNPRFTNYISIWGWATWRRAWKLYDVDAAYHESFKKQKLLLKIFPKSYFLITDFINHVIAGKNNTWDLQWALAIHVFFGAALMPPVNFIENIGFDNATHSSIKDEKKLRGKSFNINPDTIYFPDEIFIDSRFDDEINYFFNGRYSILKRFKSYLNDLKEILNH
jgi:hypothetical protein